MNPIPSISRRGCIYEPQKELQRSLGNRYSYERLLSDREIQRLKTHIPSDFSETAAAVLTAGCLRLSAVLYRSCKELLLGYDVFVKDDPASPEWIFTTASLNRSA